MGVPWRCYWTCSSLAVERATTTVRCRVGTASLVWVTMAQSVPHFVTNGFGAGARSHIMDSAIGGVRGTWTLCIAEEIVDTKVKNHDGT